MSSADPDSHDEPAASAPTMPLGPAPTAEAGGESIVVPARYQLRELLGRGGMGEVYLGADHGLARGVAVKVLLPGHDEATAAKFDREARITAALSHPGIVPVHQLGEMPDGRRFFVMRQVVGSDLAERLARIERVTPARRVELLQIFLKVCEAVAYAHSEGVVHRDLKPANVMVGGYGEVLVVDWGLARAAGEREDAGDGLRLADRSQAEDALRTMDGTIMGTPAYMPPEQAEGRIGDIDERSDIYALGALLYELLTLRPPFAGENVWSVIEQVADGRLRPPTEVADWDVPWELEAVVLRAMSRERADRYPSVDALIADVQRYLEGREVSAASYSAAQLLGRWARRHAAAVGAGAVALLALVAAGLWSYRSIGDALVREQAARSEAEGQRETARREREIARRERALAVERGEQADRARQQAESAGEDLRRLLGESLADDAEVALERHRTLDAAAYLREAARRRFLSPRLDALTLQLPDPVAWPLRRLAGRVVGTLEDGRWLLLRGRQLVALGPGEQAELLFDKLAGAPAAIGPGARWLAILLDNQRLLLRVRDQPQSWVIGDGEPVGAICGDGDRLFVAYRSGQIRGWSMPDRRELPLGLRARLIGASALRVVGQRLLCGHALGVGRSWLTELQLGDPERPPVRVALPLRTIRSLWAAPDGTVAAGGEGGAVALVAPEALRFRALLSGHRGRVVAFSGTRELLVSASSDGTARVWSLADGRCLQALADHGRGLQSVALDASAGALLTSDGATSLRYGLRAELATRPTLTHGSGQWGYLDAIGAHPRLLATTCSDGVIRTWNPTSGVPQSWWVAHKGEARALAISPDGSRIASGGEDGLVKLWTADGAFQWAAAHPSELVQLAFAPGGEWLAAIDHQGWLRCWRTRDGQRLGARFIGVGARSLQVVGGDVVCALGRFRGPQLTPIAGAEPAPAADSPRRLAVSPDGEAQAVCAGADLWLRAPGSASWRPVRFASAISAMAWVTPELLAVASHEAGTVQLLDRDGRQLAPRLRTSSAPRSLAVADGSLYVGGTYGRLWRLGRSGGWESSWRSQVRPLDKRGQPSRLSLEDAAQPMPAIAGWTARAADAADALSQFQVFVARGDAQRAAAVLRGIEPDPKRPNATALIQIRIAELRCASNLHAKAIGHARQAAAAASDPMLRLQAQLLHAQLLLWVRKIAEADRIYQAVAATPNAPADIVRRARIGLAFGRMATDKPAARRLLAAALEAWQPGEAAAGSRRCASPLDREWAGTLRRLLPTHPLALLEAAALAATQRQSQIALAYLSQAKALTQPGAPGARWATRVRALTATRPPAR